MLTAGLAIDHSLCVGRVEMMNVLLGGGVIGFTALGWVAGMVTFRRSRRWCPECGGTLRCINCPAPRPRV